MECLVGPLLAGIRAVPSHVVVVGASGRPELLDRDVWTCFQVHATLPRPTAELPTSLFKRCERGCGFSLEFPLETLAGRFVGTSFAEAEEFFLVVLRRHVLDRPIACMKDIVADVLARWAVRAQTPPRDDAVGLKVRSDAARDKRRHG